MLESLVDCGLLRRDPDGGYDTIDSLLREVAYETLPRGLRGQLHRQAADLMARPEERARHLDRAAQYLGDDQAVAAEAAEALAETGEAFIEASRHLDALAFLERAMALGCLRSSALLELARVQALCGKHEEALRTLDLVQDDPADPAVAIERDHTAANTQVFTDPEWALPRLAAAGARWRTIGNTAKEAWAHANAGVAYFYLSRMEEAAVELERGLELFQQIGDRGGGVATSSFLCLAKPADRRVPEWLGDALEFADAAGDRSKQITILTTLAWHHFFRSFFGGTEDMAEAEGFARRLAHVAEELGASEMAIHAWSLLAIMTRFSGRLDEAARHAAALQRVAGGLHDNDPWLGWAASFAVTVASGASGAAPPFPPDTSPDPVVVVARLVVQAELIMAGRLEEALARFEHAERPDLGPIGDSAGILYALALTLAGRSAEARPWLERAAGAARVLHAQPTEAAATALRAEITGDMSGLPPRPSTTDSVASVLVLRAFVTRGDTAGLDALRAAAVSLAMPGLMTGL